MQRSHRSVFGLLAVAAACLLPIAGGIHAQEAPGSGQVMTINQARNAFVSAGYRVGQAYTWDWTSPAVSTFQVRDMTDRVVMVLVYPSDTAAQTGRTQAQAEEQASTSNLGPHLVLGYGPSTWSGNVALVQTTESQLHRMYQAQVDRDNGVYVSPEVVRDPERPVLAVDLDIIQALQSGAANL